MADKQPERKIKFGMDTTVRRFHDGRRNQRARALTSSSDQAPALPVAPVYLGKGDAEKAISGAGLDPKGFGEVLTGWVETGLVLKDGTKYMIPEAFVKGYIDKQLADADQEPGKGKAGTADD